MFLNFADTEKTMEEIDVKIEADEVKVEQEEGDERERVIHNL